MSLVRCHPKHSGIGGTQRLHGRCACGLSGEHQPCNDDTFQIVLAPVQRVLQGEKGKPQARAQILDPGKAAAKDILHCKWLGQRSRHNNHNAPPVLIPEGFPARAGVSVESSSLANQFVAASRQFRDHAGAMA